MRINTNIASLNAQTNSTNTNLSLQSSLEKLSSGLKINKASDDASGMAIADKLRTQASSLGQGISNANSGSALIQIADAAMAEQSNILDTVKTKLIQASTSTTSAEGREAIRKDISKLLEQMDNISGQTNYNGVNLLDNKGAEFSFQVGEDASFDIGLETAYSVNTQGLGAGQELINDEETIMDLSGEAYIDKAGTQLTMKADNSDIALTASHSHAIVIGGAATASGTAGLSDFSIESTNVSALTFSTDGGGGGITVTTTDAALIAAFDAATEMVNNASLPGVYTIADGEDFAIEFASDVDIADLKITGATMGGAGAAGSDVVGVVTDEFTTVTKDGGVGRIGTASAEYEIGDDVMAALVPTNNLLTQGTSTADGLVFAGAAVGPILEEGTMAAQYDPSLGLAANIVGAVAIDNQSATATDEASYTLNANAVEQVNLAAGNFEVTLSTNDAGMSAKLEEMSQNNGALTKINDGAYSFKNNVAGDTANLNFGGFDVKDLTISGQTSAEIITVQTTEAVSVTKNGDTSDDNHLLLNGATIDKSDMSVTADQGNLVGANATSMQFSSTLAGLTTLGENELTSDVANEYMSVVDNAMSQLNSVRSDFGSTQNQLQVATRNMMTTQVNIKAAESIIRDVDYAAESAAFNKQNIIAQAGTYAMSQANAMQQNVLRLLQ